MGLNLVHMNNIYKGNKAAKVGMQCKCPSCGTVFTKENYQQAFCKTQNGTNCKGFFWNNVTPKKRNNTMRISPANAAYHKEHIANRFNDFDDDQSWDAHKDY